MQYKKISLGNIGKSDELIHIGFLTYKNEDSNSVDLYLIDNFEKLKPISILPLEEDYLIELIKNRLKGLKKANKKITGLNIQVVGEKTLYLSNTHIVNDIFLKNSIGFIKNNTLSLISLIQKVNLKKVTIEID